MYTSCASFMKVIACKLQVAVVDIENTRITVTRLSLKLRPFVHKKVINYRILNVIFCPESIVFQNRQ